MRIYALLHDKYLPQLASKLQILSVFMEHIVCTPNPKPRWPSHDASTDDASRAAPIYRVPWPCNAASWNFHI